MDETTGDDLIAHIAHYVTSRDIMRIVAGRLVALALALARGISLREIAEQTGVPHSTLHRWAAPFRTEAGGGA